MLTPQPGRRPTVSAVRAGSMSPLDPKSQTRVIEDVAKKVDDDRDDRAETDRWAGRGAEGTHVIGQRAGPGHRR